jgi:hypothetical protein
MKDSIKITAEELTEKLGKIEVVVKGKKRLFRYYDNRNSKKYIDSPLPPEEFIKLFNLPKSAIK